MPPGSARGRILAAARADPGSTLTQVARHAGVSRATLYRHFPSRQALLHELALAPQPAARERGLAAAVELLARDGLADLSMDAVAERAGLSRASLYRLFPGKAALFKELVRLYSPLEPIGATVAQLAKEPPEVVVPALARAAVRHLDGHFGLVRSLLFEVSSPSEEAATARQLALRTAVLPVAAYLDAQMTAGRLRRMPPLLALHAFVGPLLAHVVLRPMAEEFVGFIPPLDDVAVGQLVEVWLRGMQP